MAVACDAVAQSRTALTVVFNDESRMSFLLDERPVASFDGDVLVVSSSVGVASIPRGDVREFLFTDGVETGVSSAPTGNLTFACDGQRITLSGLDPGERAVLYDMAGRCVAGPAAADDMGCAVVQIGSLPRGVYVVKVTNHKSIKFQKK